MVHGSFCQLRSIAKLKPFLSHNKLETLIHAFISSRLDYCNALCAGISQSDIARLQLVQNAAPRYRHEEKRPHQFRTSALASCKLQE